MPEIHNHFGEIADCFDILFIDTYNTFKNGKPFLENSLNMLTEQINADKKVFILSSTPMIAEETELLYKKAGLIKGKHYSELVTFGDVVREVFMGDNLQSVGHKIYIFGTPDLSLFEKTPFSITERPDEADAFYISVPQLTERQTDENDLYETSFHRSPQGLFDSTAIEPFIPELKKLYSLGLPAINVISDFRIEEEDVFGETHSVIRQGYIAETYRRMGGRVIEYTKSYHNIFEYAREKYAVQKNDRTAIITDTYDTDITPAQNCGSIVYCVGTNATIVNEQINGGLENIFLIKSFGRP